MAKDISSSDHFNLARLGLLTGALGLFGSTAYMNISGWVAQADDAPQAIANGSMAAGFELMALCGLAWAGLQWARKRRGAAVVTGAIAAAAIVFNTFAAENFLHLQAGELANAIETSAQTAQVTQAQIDALSAELQGIVENNDGKMPRPVEAIEGYYSRFDPESNPINMSRKDAEIALREEYERVQGEISAARQAMIGDTVRAKTMPAQSFLRLCWGHLSGYWRLSKVRSSSPSEPMKRRIQNRQLLPSARNGRSSARNSVRTN